MVDYQKLENQLNELKKFIGKIKALENLRPGGSSDDDLFFYSEAKKFLKTAKEILYQHFDKKVLDILFTTTEPDKTITFCDSIFGGLTDLTKEGKAKELKNSIILWLYHLAKIPFDVDFDKLPSKKILPGVKFDDLSLENLDVIEPNYLETIKYFIDSRYPSDRKKLFSMLYNLKGLGKNSKKFLVIKFRDFEKMVEAKKEGYLRQNYRDFIKQIKPFILYKNEINLDDLNKFLSSQFEVASLLAEEEKIGEVAISRKKELYDLVGKGFDTVKGLKKQIPLGEEQIARYLRELVDQKKLKVTKIKNINFYSIIE